LKLGLKYTIAQDFGSVLAANKNVQTLRNSQIALPLNFL